MKLRCIPLILLTLFAGCGDGPATVTPASDRFVIAFYYPWYGRPDGPSGKWYHWNPASPRHDATNIPVLGLYDSRDTAVIRSHIRWAKAAGIDAFALSWWGPKSFEDQSLRVVLPVAEQENFRITVIIEHPFTREELRDDYRALLSTHAMSPAWLRYHGKPVSFFYARVMNRFTAGEFRLAFEGTNGFAIADSPDSAKAAAFDGAFSYGPVQDLNGYLAMTPADRAAHHAAGRVFVSATVPGYDDRVIRAPGRYMPRENGSMYRSMWTAAIGSDWVTVTSWNEWHEGTEIEPSVEYGESFLTLTRTLAEDWRRAK